MEKIESWVIPDSNDTDGVLIPPDVFGDIAEGKAKIYWTKTSLKVNCGNGEIYIFPRLSQIYLMAQIAMRK